MSVATPFKYHRPFPFCNLGLIAPGDLESGEVMADDLSLSDIMSLGWNLENVEIDISGTTTEGSISGSFQINPGGGAGAFSALGLGYFTPLDCAMFPQGSGAPTVRQPSERVCHAGPEVMRFSAASNNGTSEVNVYIAVAGSATYSGRYCVILNLYAACSVSNSGDSSSHILSTLADEIISPQELTPHSDPAVVEITINGLSFTAYAGSWSLIFDGDLDEWVEAEGSVADASATSTVFTYP